MRLRRLGLENYGNFAGIDLALDERPGTLNLVVAPNGAGKSVVRQAVAELLFGIQPQTPMNFQFDYARMRLVAEAVFPDGEAIGFVRRKGRANTLTDLAGQPAHPSLADRLPRESERERLKRLFVLDSAQLRAGGKALLQTDGDLADALLSSAGDLGSARALAAELAGGRDAAAPTRRSANTPFYKACDAWTAATARLDASVARPPAVAELERQRSDAARAQEAANAAANAAIVELARLKRVRSTRWHLAALDAAEEWLRAHPDAPSLAPALGATLASATTLLETAAREEAGAVEEHGRLAAALAATAVDDAALAEAAAIERLTAARGQAEASEADIPKREAELAQAQATIARLLRALSSAADPAQAQGELRAAADIAAARHLIADAAELSAARTGAAAEAARFRDALAEAEDDLAALPPPVATDTLRAVHDEAVADGDPARLARQAALAVTQAAAGLAATLARVPGWHRDAPGLATLPVPAEATLTRLDQAVAESRAAAAAAAARGTEAAATLDAGRLRLAETIGSRPLPDDAAVAASREVRDRLWSLVFARLGDAPDLAAEGALATPLPLAFVRALAAADELADRRAAEMERVATAAELQRGVARGETALAAATLQADTERARAAEASHNWAAAIGPAGLPPESSLAEARALLAGRDAVLTATAAHRDAEDAARTLADRQAGWADQLAAALATAPDTLPRLLAAARARLSEAERVAGQRQTVARAIAMARRAAAKAQPALDDAVARLAAWTSAWDAALARLQRPAGENPAVTAAVLDQLVALPAAVQAADIAQGRLAEMNAQLAGFGEACRTAAISLDEPAGDPGSIARRLSDRLAAARAASGARDGLARQERAALGRVAEATDALSAASRRQAAAIRAVGAATLGEAERRVAQAAGRAAQEDAQAAALLRLREDGEGLDVAFLRAEAAATPAQSMADDSRAAELAASTAQDAAQGAAAEVERAEGALRTLALGQEAARAAADRQAAAASAARVLEDALVQHLAVTMLDHALLEVQASSTANQRLLRIGETFARLTGGRYDRLSPAEEDRESLDHGRLIAHEPGGGDTHIARLSEGTRDQLYLALRLVAVEDHVRGAPPLPFVVDDVLQTFDDDRARAALEALVGLSEHVQVIVLTHHPHLCAVAEGLPVKVVSL